MVGRGTAPSPGTQVELRPRGWRLVLPSGVAVIVVVIAAIILLVKGPSEGVYVLLPLAVAFLARALIDWCLIAPMLTITVCAASICGPEDRPAYREPVKREIKIGEIDATRSKQRPIDRLLGQQYLYSIDGSRICFVRWAFLGADVESSDDDPGPEHTRTLGLSRLLLSHGGGPARLIRPCALRASDSGRN